MLSGLGNGGARLDTALSSPAVRALLTGRESIQRHKDSQRTLKGTIRQLDKKKVEYRKAREENRAQAEKLRQREAKVDVALDKLSTKKEEMERRLAQLRAAEKA